MRKRLVLVCGLNQQSWKCYEVLHSKSLVLLVRPTNRVDIIVDEEWKKDIIDVKRIEDHIIFLKVIVEQYIFNIISAYAPWTGLKKTLKVNFGMI